ncbi:MAG: NAD(P)H-hydrate epimerase, partial [Planctomycetes bacterium]|nr:NAD(P)H-hydrate epimerase [Planctomycetota bacterium]
FNRAEMRELDRATIEDVQIPGIILMENAGRGAALFFRQIMLQNENKRADSQDLRDLHGSLSGFKVLIVNGRGNNGGDGFVIARHMHNWGADLKILLLCKGEDLHGDALANYMIARSMNLKIIEDFQENMLGGLDFGDFNAIIDGIFGTGLTRIIEGRAHAIISQINEQKAHHVFAIDVPSGLDVDTGEILGICVNADATATFGGMKAGMRKNYGQNQCGKIRVIDISVPRNFYAD